MSEYRQPILTIGHSTLEIDAFLDLCRRSGVREIVDVRSHPTSRWEQFRQENLPKWLEPAGIRYIWQPKLGGWDVRHCENPDLRNRMAEVGVNLTAYGRGYFPKNRIGAQRAETGTDEEAWTNQGLYDYAWYTTLPEFQQAAEALMRETQARYLRRPAIMCCEGLWWKCHRSMIADYLTAVDDYPVTHLQPRVTSHVTALGNRLERYPAAVRRTWPVVSRGTEDQS